MGVFRRYFLLYGGCRLVVAAAVIIWSYFADGRERLINGAARHWTLTFIAVG